MPREKLISFWAGLSSLKMTGTPPRSPIRDGHFLLWVLTELGDDQLEALIFRYYRNSRGVINFCTRPNCTFHLNRSRFFDTS